MSSTPIFSLPISFILVLLGSIVLIVGLPVLLVGLSVWVSTRRASKRNPADSTGHAAVRRVRTGRIGGLIAGAVIAVLTYFATDGTLAPAFVGVGYLLGILVFELRPSSQPTGPIRVASLQARNAWQYLPKWVVRTTIIVMLLTVAAPALFLAVHPPSYLGEGQLMELSLPFAVMGAIALVAWIPLMNRVARLPQPATEARETGRAATSRANAARAVTGAVLGIGLLSLSGELTASNALINPLAHGTLYLFSRILVGLSIGLSIAGLVAWSILSRWRSMPAEPADPAPADPEPAEPRIA
jgi:hypothetical protein